MDSRFQVLDASLLSIMLHAFPLSWTRDPFDRLLAAHSLMTHVPLCTADTVLLRHHRLLAPELTQ
jgi:PIN domain nuclease of toxin-antitoxin system